MYWNFVVIDGIINNHYIKLEFPKGFSSVDYSMWKANVMQQHNTFQQ
jgi:hypothetical protein